jgi:hypothetical protein
MPVVKRLWLKFPRKPDLHQRPQSGVGNDNLVAYVFILLREPLL